MSFGLQNLGVINQKDAPAIWESPYADFPVNVVSGRILIDTITGSIYLDKSNSRVIISNGANNFVNGLKSYGGTLTNNSIGLGGDINRDTTLNIVDGHNFSITNELANSAVEFINGGMVDTDTLFPYVYVQSIGLTTITPNVVLRFYDRINDVYYNVLAEQP